MYVNGLNSLIKDIEWLNVLKKIKIQRYVAYKRLILALMTHLGWMWRSGKEYSKQMVTKEGNDGYIFIRQNN